MNPKLTIRTAIPEDCPVIARFNILLAQETESKQLDPTIVEAGVKALLEDPRRGQYLVACIDSRIIGQLMHTTEWSDWRNGEIWWLQSVYVQTDFRKSGVFRALYRHLEHLARQSAEVVGLRLYVEEHNSKAIEAYQSLNMQAAGYKVMQQLFPEKTSI